jgi:hypothetical protein
VVAIAAIGTYILTTSHAESPYSSSNADSGKLSGCAGINSAPAVSSGQYVQFCGAKPALSGLVIMPPQETSVYGQPSPQTDPDASLPDTAAFTGIAIDVKWFELEPSPGQYDWQPIDADLAAVSQYNSAHPNNQLSVKLRVTPGFAAPDWAKLLGSPTNPAAPITVPGDSTTPTRTIGYWWTSEYDAAWQAFNQALAVRYDNNPLVKGVQVTSCSTTTDEPFILDPNQIPIFEKNGLTAAGDEQCLSNVFNDYSAWHTTVVYYPINVEQLVADTTTAEAFSEKTMAQCATSAMPVSAGGGGSFRCAIDNHALGYPDLDTSTSWFYQTIDQLYQQYPRTTQVAFQAYNQNDGESCSAIDTAIAYHASSVELWQAIPGPKGYPGLTALPLSTLQALTTGLQTGIQPSC